jgi:hypothetical protein
MFLGGNLYKAQATRLRRARSPERTLALALHGFLQASTEPGASN